MQTPATVPGDKASAVMKALVALMQRNMGEVEQGSVSVEDLDGNADEVRVYWQGVATMPRSEIEALLAPLGSDSEA